LPLGARLVQQYGAPYWQYHRADLHQVLLNACLDPEGAGPVIQVRTSARVTGIDNSDRPVAVTAAGDRFEGDVLVGADGIRSVVRDALGFDDTLVFSGEMAYRALIDGELIAADPATRFLADRFHSTIWFGPGRHLVHYMIRGGRQFNVVAIAPARPTLEQTWTAPATAEQLVAEFTGWDDRVAAMLSKAKDEDVSVWAMYRRRRDPVWVDGRVALLGDACHAMLPYQAQGASQAMEDAAVLAEELGDVTTDGVAGALRRYANRRATRAGMVQDAAAANKDFYHLPDGPAQEERDSRLRDFTGESVVSYDWLWRGPSLNQSDAESMSYPFGG
jgi:salicylate hydroxylase